MRRIQFKQLDLVFPVDIDNEGKPMLPHIEAPTFATPKDAYSYFTRHLKGQPYEADVTDDDELPRDIFEVLESDDSFVPLTTGEATAEQSQGNANKKPNEVDDDGALATEEDTE